MDKLSIVVPVYFEEAVINRFLHETREVLNPMSGISYEYVFVDDGSQDDTVNILKQEAQQDHRIKLIILSHNHGKAYSATAGFDHAEGDYIIYMDPDLQDPPHEIPNLLAEIQKGYDLVWGVRKEKKDTFKNRVFSRFFWYILRKYTGIQIPEGIAVMRIFNRKFNTRLKAYREANRFVEGIFYTVGMKTSSIPVDQRERYAGESKFNFRGKIKLAFDAILDYSDLPLKVTVRSGFFIVALSVLFLVGLFIAKFFQDFQAGWPSLIAVIILGVGIQLIFLGIVALYIGRIYKESKRRPLYSVKEKVNINDPF